MTDRLAELLLAWEEDDVTESQLAELVELLEHDPESRRRAVSHFDMTATIAEQLQETRYTESVVDELHAMALGDQAIKHRRGRNILAWAAAMAIVVSAAATAYVFEWPLRLGEHFAAPPNATKPSDERGPVLLASRGRVRGGEAQYPQLVDRGVRLPPGTMVETNREAYATLQYDDGTTLELSPGTRLQFDSTGLGKRMSLERGALFATVAPQPVGVPMIVNAGRHDQVTVVGTRFELCREPSGEAVVRVASGSIKFGGRGQAIAVTQQQESRVVSTSDAPALPQAVTEDAIWQGWQHGLTGEYYRGHSLRGEPLTRIDARVDFDWGQDSPDPSITSPFSVRWTGEIQPPHTGDFVFTTVAYFGVRLWVDGQLLIDSTASMGSRESTQPLYLEAGRRYPIRIDYFDSQNHAHMHLLWSSDEFPQTIVDRRWLYPAEEQNLELP